MAATPPISRSRSRSRHSIPNLDKLNIAPLSSQYPLEPAGLSPDHEGIASPHASYIQGRSAPTTPGILSLSRSNSRHRRHRTPKQTYAHDGYFTSVTSPPSPTIDEPAINITKAQSSSALLPPLNPIRSSKRASEVGTRKQGTRPIHKKSKSQQTVSSDWLYRVGAAIASDARDQKGQSWLATRESSTSLTHAGDEYVRALSARDDNDLPTPRWSGLSKPASRVASRVASRHASRRGSKVNLDGLAFPAGECTPTADSHSHASFEPVFIGVDDDFEFPSSSADDESHIDDEEEIARLAREQGLGLGSWMDRLVGWTLFRVVEDGEASETEGEGENEKEEQIREALRREERRRKLKKEKESMAAASAKAGQEAAAKDKENMPLAEGEAKEKATQEGGWSDAAWLLSVASKVLL